MAEIIELGEKEYNELSNRQLQYQRDRKPAPLLGKGFSEDEQKITRLTKYLKLDTWKPEQAAFLVNGIDYDTRAFNLAGLPITPSNSTTFKGAARVLELFNSQINPPSKITPIDFVEWCKTKDINTDWITSADEWPGYVLSQTEAEERGRVILDINNFPDIARHDYQFIIKIQRMDFKDGNDKGKEFPFSNNAPYKSGLLLTRTDFYNYLLDNSFAPLGTLINSSPSKSTMIALIIDMVKMRLDSPKDYLSDNCKDMPDLLEINSSPMVRFLDCDYSIDTLIKWLTSRGIVIPRGFSKLADEVRSWMPELKPQADTEPASTKMAMFSKTDDCRITDNGDYILAISIPHLIAEQVEPLPEDTGETVIRVHKVEKTSRFSYGELTFSEVDFELLTGIFKDAGLDFDDFGVGCTKSQFEAFDNAVGAD